MLYGILATAHGAPESIEPAQWALGAYLAAAEPGTEEITFGNCADSTGGTFIMPSHDDTEDLNGLISMYESVLLVSESPIMTTPTC